MNLVLKSTNQSNKQTPIQKPLKLTPLKKPKQKKEEVKFQRYGADFFTNLNIEQINKGTSLAQPTLEIVKKSQAVLKYRDLDGYEGGKHLKYLQKKLDKFKKEGEKSRELSPNNYKFRAEADEVPELERLFQEPNKKYRRKFTPSLKNYETEDERNKRIFWEEFQPISKPYLPKKKIKEYKLKKFNHKYKGNYTDLEIKGFREIFKNEDFKGNSQKPILKKNNIEPVIGGPEEAIRKKREKLKNLRMQFVREGWMNGHRVKGGLNFATMAEQNLLRRTLGENNQMKKSVRFDEKYLSDSNLGNKKKPGKLVRKKITPIDKDSFDSDFVKICPEGCGRR